MGSVLFDGCSILFWNLGICRFLADIADARSGLKRKTVNWAYMVCIRRTRVCILRRTLEEDRGLAYS